MSDLPERLRILHTKLESLSDQQLHRLLIEAELIRQIPFPSSREEREQAVCDLYESWIGDARRDQVDRLLDDIASRPHQSIIGHLVDIAAMSKAAAAQVEAEFGKVRRKYLESLVQERPLEKDVTTFLQADPDKQSILELSVALKYFSENWDASDARIMSKIAEEVCDFSTIRQAIEFLTERVGDLTEKARANIEMGLGGFGTRPNCLLVKDKAGSGKTNLVCRLARLEHPRSICLFLTCKFELQRFETLQEMLLSSLQLGWRKAKLPTEPPKSLDECCQALSSEGLQLVVFLDGINENRDLERMSGWLLDGLNELNTDPIKFVVTCRDIFWSFFRPDDWTPYLYSGEPFDLPGFAPDQMDAIIEAYFNAFSITGTIEGKARERCRHPLILRFFCEAYRDKNIRQFDDLRLKDLFDEYWTRKKREIAESLDMNPQTSIAVEEFLFKIAGWMSDHSSTKIRVADISEVTGLEDLESKRSLFQHFLDQDIILEEMPPEDSIGPAYLNRRVSFVYDEFYDYVMAKAFIHEHDWERKTTQEISLDFVDVLDKSHRFEQYRGIAEYLVLIVEKRNQHRDLCAILAVTGQVEILCSVLPKLRSESMIVVKEGESPASLDHAEDGDETDPFTIIGTDDFGEILLQKALIAFRPETENENKISNWHETIRKLIAECDESTQVFDAILPEESEDA